MAYVTKQGAVWRVQVKGGKLRDSGTFETKRAATAWGARREIELRAQAEGREGERKTLIDAMRKFAAEVSPTRRGERWECVRLAMFERDPKNALIYVNPSAADLAQRMA